MALDRVIFTLLLGAAWFWMGARRSNWLPAQFDR